MSTEIGTSVGGVYAAVAGRLLVGPLSNGSIFVSLPESSPFAGASLPPLNSRYIVSCIAQASGAHKSSNSKVTTPAGGTAAVAAATTTGTPAAAAQAEPASSVRPTGAVVAQSRKAASDFLAQLQQRRAGAAKPPPAPTDAGVAAAEEVRDVSTGRTHAQDSEAFKAEVVKALGEDHFTSCAMSERTLETAETRETIDHIASLLATDPQAVVYVCSRSGKNRASALAMLYLQQKEQLSLTEITQRLPLSVPAVKYMIELMLADKSGRPFDDKAYFPSYFARRYPDRRIVLVQAALDTCPGDYLKVDRILQDQRTFSQNEERSARTAETVKLANANRISESDSVLSSINGSFCETDGSSENFSRRDTLTASVGLSENPNAVLAFPMPTPQTARSTISSGSGSGGAIVLTEHDEEMITSLTKAMQGGKHPITEDEVRASYIRNRRSKDKVLKELLFERSSGAARRASRGDLPRAAYSSSYNSSRMDMDGNNSSARLGGSHLSESPFPEEPKDKSLTL